MITHFAIHKGADFVRSRIPGVKSWLGQHKSLAACEGERILGAVVFDGFTPFDCNVHVAIDDRRCVTRHVLKVIFSYPFVQLGLKRVSAQIPQSNIQSLRLAKHLGFTEEGRKREGMGDEDEIILGMLKSECRWL